MATISITQIGTRVSIHLDHDDDDQARATYHEACSARLDHGALIIEDVGRAIERKLRDRLQETEG